MGCSLSRPSAYASGAGDAPTDAAGQHQSNTGYGKRHGVSTSGSAVAELLPVTSEPLFDVVGLADPSSLAVCCEDGQIAIYDWVSPTSIRKWKAHEHSVNRMAVFGDLLVSCSRDTTVKLWRVDSSELLSTFTGHTLTVSGVDFSPGIVFVMRRNRLGVDSEELFLEPLLLPLQIDGRLISSGSRDTTVRIWDVEKQAESCRNKAQRNVVTDVRWLSGYSGHVIAQVLVVWMVVYDVGILERSLEPQGSEDLNVKLWDTRTPGVLKLLNKLDGYVYFPVRLGIFVIVWGGVDCFHPVFPLQMCIDGTPDGNYLVTSSKGFNSVGAEARV
jgi:WD40 repeat protein